MAFWKYQYKEGDGSFFYFLLIPLVPIVLTVIFYCSLVIKKFEQSKSVARKLLFPVFVLATLLPGLGIPALTVITYDAWFMKYVAAKRYPDSINRSFYVVQKANTYSWNAEEISKEHLRYHAYIGSKIFTLEESREWYEEERSWGASFANPLYLLGWSIVFNIPIFFFLLIEVWLGWVTKKEPAEKVEHFDNAA